MPLWHARANAALLGLVIAEVHAQSPLWTSTALFEEWLVPQHLDQSLRAHMKPDPASIAMLTIARSAKAKAFGAGLKDALGLLQPHLLRATQVRQRLKGARTLRLDALAALDWGSTGRGCWSTPLPLVVHANSAAEALLGGRRWAAGDAPRSVGACDRGDDTARAASGSSGKPREGAIGH